MDVELPVANRPARKSSVALVWSLGVWAMGPAVGQPAVRASIARQWQQILNRRSVARDRNRPPEPVSSLTWSGVQAQGEAIQVERCSAKASVWGFYEANDAANAFKVCQSPVGSAMLVAAWAEDRKCNNPDSAIRADVCAYLVLWDDDVAQKHLLSGFPKRLWQAIEKDPDALWPLDELVTSSLAEVLTDLSQEPLSPLPAWRALHCESLLHEVLPPKPPKASGPRF